ncbi:MAG: RNA-binding cell elongation regulator Jag/EloR [Bacillota bacterium]|nr:RNA-binding cell elongation regulator Jag/EloR [Bacillota bacterium]
MRWVEAEGNTVDEAVKTALKELDAKRDEVEVDILDAGTRGFLGILKGRQARVRVRLLVNPEQLIEVFLKSVVKAMGLDVSFCVTRAGEYWHVDFEGPDVRILIGRRGDTLDALQLLVNLVIGRRCEEKERVILDAEGYRQRREETLRRLARRISERVRRFRRDVALEPMTPQERRVIHMELQENPWVYTISQGEEPYRKVIICLRR